MKTNDATRASADAVPESSTTDNLYIIGAILDVCAHAARNLDNVGDTYLPRISGNMADLLEHAGKLNVEVHTAFERSVRKAGAA